MLKTTKRDEFIDELDIDENDDVETSNINVLKLMSEKDAENEALRNATYLCLECESKGSESTYEK